MRSRCRRAPSAFHGRLALPSKPPPDPVRFLGRTPIGVRLFHEDIATSSVHGGLLVGANTHKRFDTLTLLDGSSFDWRPMRQLVLSDRMGTCRRATYRARFVLRKKT
jgi:hypothetical protein